MKYMVIALLMVSSGTVAAQDDCAHAQDFWKGTVTEVRSVSEFYFLCMDVWARTDLVHAIHTNCAQRSGILEEIAQSVGVLYRSCDLLFGQDSSSGSYETTDQAIELIEKLQEAIQIAFAPCDGEYYAVSLQCMDEMVDRLKAPVHIDAEGAA